MKTNQADVTDQDILLKKLEEYGNSLEYEGDVKSTKRRKNRISLQNVTASPLKKKTKKKKKQKNKSSSSGEVCKTSKSSQEDLVSNRKLSKKEHWLQDVLGSAMLDDDSAHNVSVVKPAEIKPITSKHKRKAEPEVIVFHDPAKRKKKLVAPDVSSKSDPDDKCPEFDMRQARYDVRKFGIKGFDDVKKGEAMTSLLISLGAKPPNNKYYNYKVFQEIRKKEMQTEQDKIVEDKASGLKVSKKKKKRLRDQNDIGELDGRIGTYRSGVQFIKKKNIQQKSQ